MSLRDASDAERCLGKGNASEFYSNLKKWHRWDLNLRPTDPETETITTHPPRARTSFVLGTVTP